MAKKLVRTPQVRPMTLFGHFVLSATGLETTGRPSLAEYEGAYAFCLQSHKASGFWLADLRIYARTRPEWADKLSQVEHALGLSEKTMANIDAVGGSIPKSRRREAVEFSHHAEVASLPPVEQEKFLKMAEDEGLSVRELRLNIRAFKRSKIIEGQATLDGLYRVIYADPPWLYNDSGPTEDGSLGKAERHYPGMTIEELCKLPVGEHSLPDSVLFMWVTVPMLYENPGPREVIEAWGFKYKSNRAWNKVLGNFGHYFHVNHEHLIIATKGSCLPDRPTPQPDSLFTVRRSNVHSQKPEEARRDIMQLYDGPYLELFGRERVEGWTVFGNDARLWAGAEVA